MNTALPMFESMPVVTSALRLTGKSTERVGSLDVGEEVFLLVKAYVSGVNHETSEIGLERHHSLKAEEIVIVLREDGQRMFDEAQLLSDDRFGLQSMFDKHGFTVSDVDPETNTINLKVNVDPETGEIENDE